MSLLNPTAETIVHGAIAISVMAPLGIVAIIEVSNGRPISEPTELVGLAAVVIGFYFGQRNGYKNGIATVVGKIDDLNMGRAPRPPAP